MTNEASLQDVEQALARGATVLDVRESEEYAGGHLPGARLLPLGVLPVRMHELVKEPVYVVCQSGGRSAQAQQLLARAGFDARSVSGGTAAWTSSGRPVETGRPPT